jgi:hypothetical protein
MRWHLDAAVRWVHWPVGAGWVFGATALCASKVGGVEQPCDELAHEAGLARDELGCPRGRAAEDEGPVGAERRRELRAVQHAHLERKALPWMVHEQLVRGESGRARARCAQRRAQTVQPHEHRLLLTSTQVEHAREQPRAPSLVVRPLCRVACCLGYVRGHACCGLRLAQRRARVRGGMRRRRRRAAGDTRWCKVAGVE